MKNIIIAGAGGPLGQYLQKSYLKDNFNVISISRKKNYKFKSKFKNLHSYSGDLSDKKITKEIYKKISKKFKKIDFIISCVGKSNFKKINDRNKEIDEWKVAIDDNLIANVNLIDEYLTSFSKKLSNTKIILISSIAGVVPISAPISYSTSKSALIFYSKLMAKKLAKNKINLNCISPGNIFIKNNLWYKKMRLNKNKTLKYIKKNVPLNDFCRPDQIKSLCDYLISPKGKFIVGANFIIDGGQVLNEK